MPSVRISFIALLTYFSPLNWLKLLFELPHVKTCCYWRLFDIKANF